MMNPNASTRTITTVERPGIPLLSFVLGFGPVLVIAAVTLATAIAHEPARSFLASLTVVIAASILAFLAGVRRGLSFRTEGGPRAGQIVTVLALYGVAFFSLLAGTMGWLRIASCLAAIGFAALMVLDPVAARKGETPWFFSRLRPPQMLIAAVSLGGLAILLGQHG